MSVTGADLVAIVRRKANVERSRFVTDDEILGFCNDSVAELWDLVVNSSEGYFSRSATFTLAAGANSIGLAEITSGIPPVPAYPVLVPVIDVRTPVIPNNTFSGVVAASSTKQFFAVSGTASFSSPQGYVPPAGRILQLNITSTLVTANTRFTIYRNGLPTDATVSIPSGTSGSTNALEADFGAPVYFNGEDTMDLVAEESGSLASYSMESTTIYQLDQPVTDFMKELAISRNNGGCFQEIPRLKSLSDRGRVGMPHFWIAGDTVSFYPLANLPVGEMTLDYVPRAPVIALTDIMPDELDRFRDFIETGAAISVKAKRGMADDVASFSGKQQQIRARIIASLVHRKVGPRTIQMPDSERARVYRRRYGDL